MPNSFFILLRYFLRIDGVMLRMNDTRYYHEFDTDFILREYTSKEAKAQDLNVSKHNIQFYNMQEVKVVWCINQLKKCVNISM